MIFCLSFVVFMFDLSLLICIILLLFIVCIILHFLDLVIKVAHLYKHRREGIRLVQLLFLSQWINILDRLFTDWALLKVYKPFLQAWSVEYVTTGWNPYNSLLIDEVLQAQSALDLFCFNYFWILLLLFYLMLVRNGLVVLIECYGLHGFHITRSNLVCCLIVCGIDLIIPIEVSITSLSQFVETVWIASLVFNKEETEYFYEQHCNEEEDGPWK